MEARFTWQMSPFGQLDRLSTGLKNKAIRISMNKASACVKAAIVSQAPERYGYLKKSIRIKIANYQNKQVWVSIIGPKSDFKKSKGKRTRGKLKGTAINHRPALYARLVNFGTKHATAKPFLTSGLAQTQAQFGSILCSAIEEQVAKLLG